MKTYVLDTSALLCYLRNESGSDHVFEILRSKSHVIKMHQVNLGEIYYGLLRMDGEKKANHAYGVLLQYPIHWVEDLGDTFLMTSGKLKIEYRLGFADSFAAATAILNQAILITKDNDFRPIAKDSLLQVLWV